LVCLKYPRNFGKPLINFFKENGSQGILEIIGLRREPATLIKKKKIRKPLNTSIIIN
jgi:hypothetical protein